MVKIGITTGKADSPRLELIEVEEGDWDYAISFRKKYFVIWLRYEKNEAGTAFTKMKKFTIKVSGNSKKITNAEKITEVEFVAPTLPPADTLDPYNFYYQTYNVELEPPTPCEEESLTRFKLVTKKNKFYTTTNPAQLIPHGSDTLSESDTLGGGDTLSGEKGEALNVFLKTHNAFKEDTLDNRAVFFAGAMRNDTDTIAGNDTTGGTLKCVYDPNPSDFLVPLAGLGLTKDDNSDDFIIQDFVAIQF